MAEIGGWFPEANRRVLAQLIGTHHVKSVIEIGSFLGCSAAWFAHRVERVTCIDRWYEPAQKANNNNLVDTLDRYHISNDFYSLFENNMRSEGVWDKITTIRGDSRDVHSLVGDADLLYIDGDHSLFGCMADIRLYGPKAKIICGDDYVDRADFGVVFAVDQLLPQRKVDFPFWWYVKEAA